MDEPTPDDITGVLDAIAMAKHLAMKASVDPDPRRAAYFAETSVAIGDAIRELLTRRQLSPDATRTVSDALESLEQHLRALPAGSGVTSGDAQDQ